MKDGKQQGSDVCLTGLAGRMTAEERRSLPGSFSVSKSKTFISLSGFQFFGKANPGVSRREAVKVRRGKSPPSKLTHATFFFFFFFSPLSLITQMVTARAGIRSAGRRPMGEPLASPRSRAAVIGRAEAGKDGRSLRRSVSVMMKRPAAKKRRKKKQRRDVGNANPTRPF